MSDKVTQTNSIWMAALLDFLGYPLCEMELGIGRRCTWTYACPKLDYEIIESDWEKGQCAVTDIKAFVYAYRGICMKQQSSIREGRWVNPDFIAGKIG